MCTYLKMNRLLIEGKMILEKEDMRRIIYLKFVTYIKINISHFLKKNET